LIGPRTSTYSTASAPRVPHPTVSILVAAYNAEPYLAATLDSALTQTHPPAEVVVVDDGSTDGTLSVARRFEEAHPERIRVIEQENAGACAARNRAFNESTGDFIQFLDSDDLLHPEKLERQLRRLSGEPDGTVATGPWVRFYGDLSTADHAWVAPDFRDYEPATDWLIQSWEGRGTIPLHAWLIPRAVAERAGPWDEALLRNQDGEYAARLLVAARKIAFTEGAWAYYRSGLPGSISRQASDAALASLYDSTVLCERTLLAYRDTPEARRAVAGLYQQFLFTAYPRVPDLCRIAEARVRALGGYYRKPGVIRPLRPIRDAFGWKAALRIQNVYRRLLANRNDW
jgi:glycosyltransferase involved in cell wall biosynthesis